MDLVTVVAHELGHALGLDHDHAGTKGIMTETLGQGVRRLPGVNAAGPAGASVAAGSSLATLIAQLSDHASATTRQAAASAPAEDPGNARRDEKFSDFLNFGDRRVGSNERRAERLGDFLSFGASAVAADRSQPGRGRGALAELSRQLSHLK